MPGAKGRPPEQRREIITVYAVRTDIFFRLPRGCRFMRHEALIFCNHISLIFSQFLNSVFPKIPIFLQISQGGMMRCEADLYAGMKYGVMVNLSNHVSLIV